MPQAFIMIKVVVIEDIIALRENVCYFLEITDGIEVDQEFGSIESFFDFLENRSSYEADILLLDIGLPGMSGLEALPLLRDRLPDMDIIMLTAFEDESNILTALCSGAVGYLSKKATHEEIVNAIRIVKEGGSYMSPGIAREIVHHLVRPQETPKPTILSDRQLEIIDRLAKGHSYSQIADELCISVETVRSHIKKMYKTLAVNNKAEAIALYLKGKIR